MGIESKEYAVELINTSIPYPEHITDWDFSKSGAVYFTWRSNRFKLELAFCSVMEVTNNGAILQGSNLSICMAQLIKNRALAKFMAK